MIFVLTYHKICNAGADLERDFYSVSRDFLVANIKAMLQLGYRDLSLKDLLAFRLAVGPGFLLTFDDGTSDHHEIVLPLLKEMGLHGIFFVPTAKLNRPGYLTEAQVREISKAGHTIGLHGHEHRRLDRITDDELRDQFQRSRDIITRLTGEPPWCFAPPGGFMTEQVREVALGFDVQVIRTMRWGFNHRLDLTALEAIPVNRYTQERQFQRILQGKQPQLFYFGKQAAKALVPMRAYAILRRFAFTISRRT
jgi:peptidoglycan/xylan/chitin deacetylase (PgdA/CDA1 family)